MTKRALLLISDTGGGHRSAANAIAAATGVWITSLPITAEKIVLEMECSQATLGPLVSPDHIAS